MSLEKNLKNAGLSATDRSGFSSNNPAASRTKKTEYLARETLSYNAKMFEYGSDVFTAQVQGLNPSDIYEFQKKTIRLAGLVTQTPTAKQFEDYRVVYFKDPTLNYIAMGSKIVVNYGNTMQVYLVVNAQNMVEVNANAIVRRCNAVWNFLDYYGNVINEPFVWNTEEQLADTNKIANYSTLLVGHNHSMMQINHFTEGVNPNSRVILGKQAFKVSGLVNFLREFTGSEPSKLQYFDLFSTEPTENDDLENEVADGKSLVWRIELSGNEEMPKGTTQTIGAKCYRNGVEVTTSANFPLSLMWTSSDRDVATISKAGLVTAVSEGDVEITCQVIQNPSIKATFALSVAESVTGTEIVMNPTIPNVISQFESYKGKAEVWVNGEKTSNACTFELNGVKPIKYEHSVDGNEITITCYEPSDELLALTVRSGDATFTKNIALVAF